MKNKLRYLFGIFLLMAGLLAGCTGTAEIQTAERIAADVEQREEEIVSEEEEYASKEEETVLEEKEHASKEEETVLEDKEHAASKDEEIVLEEEEYTSKEEVAAYIHLYGHLPDNYITKDEAKELGWISKEGNLGEVAPGKSIGGDHFGNYEEKLPEKEGRNYYECDIDGDGGYRNSKRIIYSDDGLIFYTDDHYETFECLYGEE